MLNQIVENMTFYQALHLVILVGGGCVAWRQLINNVKAQRALRSPALYVYCPKGDDPINGLVIKNAGDVIATDITITVSEKRKRYSLFRKRQKSKVNNILLLAKDVEERIFSNGINGNDFSNINVKVKYHSPYHYKTTLKYKNTFSRRGNHE